MISASTDLDIAVRLAGTGDQPDRAAATAETEQKAMQSDTRSRIIETAEQLIRRFGHQKTKVSDIARALSMSPANIYRYFPSKDAINDAVCRHILDEEFAVASAIAHSDASAQDRLRALLLALARVNMVRCMTDEQLHEVLAIAARGNWSIVIDYGERLEAILTKIVSDGIERGEFAEKDAQRASRCVLLAMMRYLHPPLVVEFDRLGETKLEDMINFCLSALR